MCDFPQLGLRGRQRFSPQAKNAAFFLFRGSDFFLLKGAFSLMPFQGSGGVYNKILTAAQPRFWPVLARLGSGSGSWLGLGLRPCLLPSSTAAQ